MKLGKPIKYVAVEPKEVVERVKKLVMEDAKDKHRKLDELKTNDVLKELNLLHKQGIEFIEPSDLSGAIRGRHNLYAHLEYMIKNAEKNITLMTSSKGLIRKLEALKPELERLNKKGVKIRIAAPITKESTNAVKELSKLAEIKNSNKLNARFCIVDGKDVMFMAMDDETVHPSYDVGIWINTPYFANALESLFNNSWKDMEDANKAIEK
jgi:sugar-specific transcriptional regulator TrmB